MTSQSAIAVLRRHHLAHALDAALGVGEGAVLLQEGGARQEDMGVVRGLVQEEVLDDDAFHRRQAAATWLVLGSDCTMSSPWM